MSQTQGLWDIQLPLYKTRKHVKKNQHIDKNNWRCNSLWLRTRLPSASQIKLLFVPSSATAAASGEDTRPTQPHHIKARGMLIKLDSIKLKVVFRRFMALKLEFLLCIQSLSPSLPHSRSLILARSWKNVVFYWQKDMCDMFCLFNNKPLKNIYYSSTLSCGYNHNHRLRGYRTLPMFHFLDIIFLLLCYLFV